MQQRPSKPRSGDKLFSRCVPFRCKCQEVFRISSAYIVCGIYAFLVSLFDTDICGYPGNQIDSTKPFSSYQTNQS